MESKKPKKQGSRKKMKKEEQDLFDYDNLTLVDKPDSPLNAGLLPQTVRTLGVDPVQAKSCNRSHR